MDFSSINSDLLGKTLVFTMDRETISGKCTAIIYPGIKGERIIILDSKKSTPWLNHKSKFQLKLI